MGDAADDLFDQYNDFDGHDEVGIICAHCDEEGLRWEETTFEVWRLFDADGNQHICHALEGFEREL